MTSPTTIRLDEKTKAEASKLAENLGIPLNSLINALLKKAVREGGADLRIRNLSENGFTPEFEDSVLAADKEGSYKKFSSINKMIKSARAKN